MSSLLEKINSDIAIEFKKANIEIGYLELKNKINADLYEMKIESCLHYINSCLKLEKKLHQFKNLYIEHIIYKLNKEGDVVDSDPGFFLDIIVKRSHRVIIFTLKDFFQELCHINESQTCFFDFLSEKM